MKYKLLFLDTETTGNEEKDFLCQLCFSVDKKVENELFNPPVPISIESQAVHHITPKMVKDKPAFKDSDLYKDLDNILKEEDTVLIAHNAKFDIGMLNKEGLNVHQFICTLRVARYLDKNDVIPRYNLQYLRYYLEMDIEASAHDAMGDVLVLKELFNRLFEKIKKEENISDDEVIEKMLSISSHPSLINIFNFGKYTGKKVKDVLEIDRGYLEWLLKQKLESQTDEEDWIYTLEYYLK
jgi:exodeoxyribonuclease X